MTRKMNIAFVGLILLFFVGQTNAKSISVTSPAAGGVWHKGQTYTITWVKTGDMDAQVKLRILDRSASAIIEPIIDYAPNSGHFSWTVPSFLALGDYVIRVSTMDNEVTGDSAVFAVADFISSRSKTVTFPSFGACLSLGQSYEIRWNQGAIPEHNVRLELLPNNSFASLSPIATATANDGSHFWVVPTTIPAGDYTIRVMSLDNRLLGDSEPFQLKASEGGEDPELAQFKQMMAGIREIHLQRDPVGPVGREAAAPLCIDLRRIRDICQQAGLKAPVKIELVGANGIVTELGVFGTGMVQGNALGIKKLNPHLTNQMQNDQSYSLVVKNAAGKVLHVQTVQIRE